MGTKASQTKLTKRVVDSADGTRGRHYLWDSELRGFGVQVEATGTKTYFVRYRPRGHGRAGTRRFLKLGRHGEITADEARVLAKAALGKVAAGEDPAAERAQERRGQQAHALEPTFNVVASQFISQYVMPFKKPSTASLYKILLHTHILPIIGNRRVNAVTRNDIVQLHLGLQRQPTTANRVLAVISSLYSFAARQGLVAEGFNPAKGIEKYRERCRERYLTSEELQRLGAALAEAETIGVPWQIDLTNAKAKHVPKRWKGQREKLDPNSIAAIRLLLFTGARLREILHLKWENVDLERGLLFLPDSKTGKKTLVISGTTFDVLLELERSQGSGRQGFVIKGAVDGNPRADLKKPWRTIQRQAQLEGVRLHDLRHTFASIGAGSSLGLPIVGKLLGHSQPQTTARYAHLDSDPLRRAANIIGDHLAAALAPRSTKPTEPV